MAGSDLNDATDMVVMMAIWGTLKVNFFLVDALSMPVAGRAGPSCACVAMMRVTPFHMVLTVVLDNLLRLGRGAS
jgi:hypothetical protein